MNEKLLLIISLLFERTSNKLAGWSLTDDGFLININGRSYLTLQKFYNSHLNENVYVVNLYNDNGKKIAELNTDEEFIAHNQLEELYDMVYSQYHKVEETLDDLLNTLQRSAHSKIGDENFNPKEDDDDDLPF